MNTNVVSQVDASNIVNREIKSRFGCLHCILPRLLPRKNFFFNIKLLF